MADAADDLFVFNGIDGASGRYLLEPLGAKQVVELALGKDIDEVQREAKDLRELGLLPSYDVREDVDPKSVAEAGWGVIFAHGEDPKVMEALEPLLRHRKAQAAAIAEKRYRDFRGPLAYRPGESKSAFLSRHGAPTSGPVDPDRMPYYLLLVGSPEKIPYWFQSQLDLQYAVGRICFDTPDEYANYAASVIESESGKVRLARRVGLFGVRNPDDRATNLSADGLIANLDTYVRNYCPGWSIDSQVAEHATKATLGEMLGGAKTPAVLLTASHGMSFPQGHPRHLPHQGALLCQDWEGPREHSGEIGPELYFSADDLGDSKQLLGLIAFCFACYGGGTPRFDAFLHDGSAPRQIAQQAFLSRLPLRMLAHPRGGALAMVAHVERAWSCSFTSPKTGSQTAVFESFTKRLLDGHPVGSALDCFGARYGELSSDLVLKLENRKFGDTSVSEIEIASDWTANNDARNYLVIGDPAVRVPVVDETQATERPALELRTITPQAPITATPSMPAPPVPAPPRPAPSGPVPAPPPGGGPEAFGVGGNGIAATLHDLMGRLGTKLAAALEDMSSLEVWTYVASDSSQLGVQSGPSANAQPRAYTRIAFDGDTVMYVPERDGEIDAALFDLHMRVVAQAQAARAELMKTIVQAAAGLTGLGK